MSAHNASPGEAITPEAALAALADELDQRDFVVTLTPGDGGRPRLTVLSRHAQLAEDIYADARSYWWPWAQPIAAVGNPKAAATKISHVLRAAPGEPSYA